MTAPLRLLWLVSFPLEAAAGRLLVGGGWLGITGGAVLHVVAAAIFGFSLLTRREGRPQWAWPVLGGTAALLAFPVLGMLAMAVAFALTHTVFRRDSRTAAKLSQAVETDEEPADAVARAHEVEVALLDELEIEPVVDVLREDDPELKRAAIDAIARQGGVSAVRLLIGLLHDPSPEARFFASIGLSRLEDEISRTILAAQRRLAEDPQAPGLREHVAQLYLDYAVSGFLEGVTRDYYLDLARQMFEEARATSPRPEAVIRRLAQVHLLLRNIAEAAALLDQLARQRAPDPELHLLRMDVAYQFGDFRELAVYARRVLPSAGDGRDAPVPGAAAGDGHQPGALPSGGDIDARALIAWWADAGRREAQVGV